jgi:hypothetical protein
MNPLIPSIQAYTEGQELTPFVKSMLKKVSDELRLPYEDMEVCDNSLFEDEHRFFDFYDQIISQGETIKQTDFGSVIKLGSVTYFLLAMETKNWYAVTFDVKKKPMVNLHYSITTNLN